MDYEETIQYVMDVVQSEGFDYAFISYSDFKEVKDEEFQILRKTFVEAYHALLKYLEERGYEEE